MRGSGRVGYLKTEVGNGASGVLSVRGECAHVCGPPKGVNANGRVHGDELEKSSDSGHGVDALAQTGDEGRGKLRKASGSRKLA